MASKITGNRLSRFATIAAGTIAAAAAAAHGQCDLQEIFKVLADDGVSGDKFGYAAAISGTTVIVGAPFDPSYGDQAGAAYLYDTVTGSQIGKLVAQDGQPGDRFGVSVAIFGTTAVVGASGDDDNGNNSGSVYVFDTITGNQIVKLLPDDGAAGDRFGSSVAISEMPAIPNTIVMVGASGNDDFGDRSGSAYLFHPVTGGQIAKILPDDAQAQDHFGASVAIDYPMAVITATWDDDNGMESGSAYIFDCSDPGNPVQTGKFAPDDGAPFDFFGTAAAIYGNTAIVASWQDDDLGEWSGSAYLFDVTSATQIAKLLPEDGAARDFFGRSVAITDSIAIVGSAQFDGVGIDSGAAYLYDTATGAQFDKLVSSDNEAFDQFGSSVAINEHAVFVGAHRDGDNGPDAGAGYIFDCQCPADINNDGQVDIFDMMEYLGWFTSGDMQADWNGDGELNILDILAYLNDFAAGCA